MSRRTALIIGAGPAGLTAAYELLTRSNIRPVLVEASEQFGGLARTVHHNGNRMDIGGHRFFSKSERVNAWWFSMLPLQGGNGEVHHLRHQGRHTSLAHAPEGPDPAVTDAVMLVRERRSRIYFLRQFFDYPLSLGFRTVARLGALRTLRIGMSYLRARLFPLRAETNLEQFFVNRFGRELYRTFFRSYTEKVWGVPCREIPAEWGAQRVKGLSVGRAIGHALSRPFRRRRGPSPNGVETSLIERFLYPKYGPGQMWEACAQRVRDFGGEILLRHRVERIDSENGRVSSVTARDAACGETRVLRADFVFSSMPVKDLVRALGDAAPPAQREIAEGLVYRDFITVGLLVDGLKIQEGSKTARRLLRDNWIYIQEPDVRLGRLQIFNNWSPYLVADPKKVWLGLEYFCDEGDDLWRLSDEAMAAFGAEELERIGLLDASRVLDRTVLRVEKTYPAYLGTYPRFGELRAWLDGIENLFLVGRNGMHRYNNQDHSMLTAMTAVDNILEGRRDKANVWAVNTEQDHHEQGARRD